MNFQIKLSIQIYKDIQMGYKKIPETTYLVYISFSSNHQRKTK